MEEEGGGVRSGPGAARTILLFPFISARPPKQPIFFFSRGLGRRMHLTVEVTESSTNKQHHLSLTGGLEEEDGEEDGEGGGEEP